MGNRARMLTSGAPANGPDPVAASCAEPRKTVPMVVGDASTARRLASEPEDSLTSTRGPP